MSSADGDSALGEEEEAPPLQWLGDAVRLRAALLLLLCARASLHRGHAFAVP
jgi:hypothetical protein